MSTITFDQEIVSINNQITKLIQNAPEKKQHILKTVSWMLEQVIKKDSEVENVEETERKICDAIEADLSNMEIGGDFIKEVIKLGGCITGSFVLKHIMQVTNNVKFVEGDVDILIPLPACKNIYGWTEDPEFINKFIADYEMVRRSETTYQLVDYLHASYVLEGPPVRGSKRFNIIYITCNVDTFIRSFDMGCCKNYYNGEKLVSLEYDAIKRKETSVAYNKISVDKIYKGNARGQGYPVEREEPMREGSIFWAPLYAHFRILYDTYFKKEVVPYKCVSGGILINNITQYSRFKSEMVQQPGNMEGFLANLKYNKEYFGKVNEYFPILEIIEQIQDPELIDQNVVNVMNMIRCYERIEKYKSRGIETFTVVA